MGVIQVTFILEELEQGRTRLNARMTGSVRPFPGFISRPALRLIFTHLFDYHSVMVKLRNLIAAETPGTVSPE